MTKNFICNFNILQGLFHKIARGYIVKIPKISSHPHRLRPRVVISISLRLSKQQRTGSGSKASTGSVESSKAWSPPAAAQAAARPPWQRRNQQGAGTSSSASTARSPPAAARAGRRGEGCAAAGRLGTKRVAGEDNVGAHTRSVEVISELQPCIQRGSARRFDLGARAGDDGTARFVS